MTTNEIFVRKKTNNIITARVVKYLEKITLGEGLQKSTGRGPDLTCFEVEAESDKQMNRWTLDAPLKLNCFMNPRGEKRRTKRVF